MDYINLDCPKVVALLLFLIEYYIVFIIVFNITESFQDRYTWPEKPPLTFAFPISKKMYALFKDKFEKKKSFR